MIWDMLQQTGFNNYFESVQTLTIQTLLLDQNIITQFKNINPKLIQYVQAHYDQFISKLIQYTIQLPKQTDSQDRIRKLPYVSSQLLAIDNQTIYKAFFNQQKQYFQQLFNIFNTQSKQNQILMGYLIKIIQNLYKCQKKKVSISNILGITQLIFRYFLFNYKQTAQKIYKNKQILYLNLDKEAVATILKLCLVLLQTQQGFLLNKRKQIVSKLIEQLNNKNQSIKNVSKNVLIQVINKFQTFSSGDELLNHIISSQKLTKIFQIQNSESIDDFIIGYMKKGLQKICTSGQQKKSLLQIPQSHKNMIKSYIVNKKVLLINNINQVQNKNSSSFKNQVNKTVYKLDKQILLILSIMKLGLQNGIVGFLNQQDILELFSLLTLHPYNDILKVTIFDIFNLIYLKKDEQSQIIFNKYYYTKSIHLFNLNKNMFSYFLYQLNKNIYKKINPSHLNQQLNLSWSLILQTFLIYQNYQKQTQKVIDRYSNRTKVIKLLVDQQDTPNNSITNNTSNHSQPVKQSNDSKQSKLNEQIESKLNMSSNKQPQKSLNCIEQSTNQKNKQLNDPFSFEFFSQPVKLQPVKSQKQNKPNGQNKADPFSAFDFFNTSPKKEQKKKTDFSAFYSFF